MKEAICNMALFASGNGTNVQRICEYFRGHPSIHPAVVICNNPEAYVLERAERLSVPAVMASPAQIKDPGFMLPVLRRYSITHIVLAGFLCRIPAYLVESYDGRIVNIHPALLPKFGGKGMYGMHVHEAVVKAQECRSGITIHLVDSQYDHGTTLFQASFPMEPDETAGTVASKVHALEQAYFPLAIEKWITGAVPGEFPVLDKVETCWNNEWGVPDRADAEQNRMPCRTEEGSTDANMNTQTF